MKIYWELTKKTKPIKKQIESIAKSQAKTLLIQIYTKNRNNVKLTSHIILK